MKVRLRNPDRQVVEALSDEVSPLEMYGAAVEPG
jgi:hypothetical protein